MLESDFPYAQASEECSVQMNFLRTVEKLRYFIMAMKVS